MQVADKEDVDVARAIGPGAIEQLRIAAEQVGGPGMAEALARQRLDAGDVDEDQVAAPQGAAVVVPQQVPVRRQGDQRHRCRPQAVRHRRVIEVEGHEVGPPAGGQPGQYVVPGVGVADGQVSVTAGVEGEAAAGVWQGNPHHKWDRWRSVPLMTFAPLAEVPGVRLISLQHGPGVEQLDALKRRVPVTQLGKEFGATNAFMDTAAVMAGLDLVVTVDTATAHLAGALGVPVWMPLPTLVDWRWLLGRDDSPWYPTMRLFRQSHLGDWEPVFERMAAGAQKHGAGVEVTPWRGSRRLASLRPDR